MEDFIFIRRQFVLDAINIGLSGYVSDDDKLTLEGMGIAVSEMPTTDLSVYSDRLWKSAYDRGYERCKEDAVDVVADGLKGVFVEYEDIAKKMLAKLPPRIQTEPLPVKQFQVEPYKEV